jgi:hypothetical protein
MEKVAPLSKGFLLVAIIGFFFSYFMIFNKISKTWGFTFMLFCIILFIASFISMTYADADTLIKLDKGK